ncbi:MAG: hypothetical protein GX051_01960 [Clostridiales bacterium]|nr:hypothetical protein [Clostridiales bacterium]
MSEQKNRRRSGLKKASRKDLLFFDKSEGIRTANRKTVHRASSLRNIVIYRLGAGAMLLVSPGLRAERSPEQCNARVIFTAIDLNLHCIQYQVV